MAALFVYVVKTGDLDIVRIWSTTTAIAGSIAIALISYWFRRARAISDPGTLNHDD
jgi:hypothetical protein